MQRIELRLIYFPEEKEWRIYSHNDYRVIPGEALRTLHAAIADTLAASASGLQTMSDNIRYSNATLTNPTEE